MRRAMMLPLVWVALGCTSSESAPTPASAPAQPEAAPVVASPQVAAPLVDAIDDESDRRGEMQDPSETVLNAVARGYSPLRLFRTGDRALFVAAGVQAIRIPGRGPLARDPTRLVSDVEALAKLPDAAPLAIPADRGVVEPSGLVRVAPDDVWLHHGAGVLHFDGTTWSKVELPYDGGVPSLAVSPELGLWIVIGSERAASADDNALFRRVDEVWTEIEMPSLQFPVEPQPTLVFGLDDDEMAADAIDPSWQHTLVPMQVIADKNDLWVTTRGPAVRRGGRELGTYRWALLHNRYRGVLLELPDAETMRREMLDLGPDQPFTGRESCEVFVPIAVDEVGDDHDELRKELDEIGTVQGGMVLVEVVHDGAPAIGVAIAGGRSRKAKALVAALRRTLGGRMGAPICQPMIATRVIERWSSG